MKYCLDCDKPKSKKGNYCKTCGYKHRIRRKGLIYKIVVINKGWFKKGEKHPRPSSPYFDKTIGYMKISIDGKEIKYHRYLMEKYLNRKLLNTELVHHINGNRIDNRIENLKIMTLIEHTKYHWNKRKNYL